MSDASDPEDVESIREQKKEELLSRAESPEEPVHVEDAAHFEDLVEDHHVVLVDFYADWCGPCKMLEPTVETIAADTGATVAKVDVDAHQDLARQYSVQGVPTLYLFVDGEPEERMVGVQDENDLRELVGGYE